ncbi:hypothetical protein RUM43_006526 [Polyplax serrata]|uniref:Uncharacterized protein n=1 Tax=Polyplax serrata TaxID=468196 RepID=A0AAN8PF40_POLSC
MLDPLAGLQINGFASRLIARDTKLKRVDLNKVTIRVRSLVQSKTVGHWVIENCLNCSIKCYTTNTDRSLTLANGSLVSHPDVVANMRSMKDYSPVFRIIVKPLVVRTNDVDVSDSKKSPQKLQTALTSLQQQLNEAIREQVTKTEEVIRQFTEQQYALLEQFRERAAVDHQVLALRVYEAQPRLENDVVPAVDAPVELIGASAPKKVLCRKKQDGFLQDSTQVSTHSHNQSHRNVSTSDATSSLDSEGLFVLEGMEESVGNEPGHSEGESDTDHDDSGSHDEGIDVHRKRTSSIHLAKSLPVNVPVYSVPSTDFDNDDDERRGVVDIAASIKALARSVHGDAIFGDLPRPRFSTQI